MADDDLVSLKVVLDEVGVSRATLWRALKSDINGMPAPMKQRQRLFWRRSEVASIDRALDAFEGRGSYERAKAKAMKRGEELHAELVEQKNRTRRRKRRSLRKGEQGDLFAG